MLRGETESDTYVAVATALATLEQSVAIVPNSDISGTVLTFQCEAVTIADLVAGTIAVVVDTANDASGSILGIDCGGVIRIDNGFRAWGTIRIIETTAGDS